jgi:hypothetical protein
VLTFEIEFLHFPFWPIPCSRRIILDLTTSFAFSVEPNVIELPCGRTRSTSVSYSAFLAEMGYRTVQVQYTTLHYIATRLPSILPVSNPTKLPHQVTCQSTLSKVSKQTSKRSFIDGSFNLERSLRCAARVSSAWQQCAARQVRCSAMALLQHAHLRVHKQAHIPKLLARGSQEPMMGL